MHAAPGGHEVPSRDGDRAIRRSTSRRPGVLWDRLAPIKEHLLRLQARTGPVLRLSSPAAALQARLLERVNVVGYNDQGPPRLSALVSQAASAAQVLDPVYEAWAGALGEAPRFHRKQWEYVAILQAAELAGALRQGKRAIGFGVGTEPLPALLAARGVSVLATDQPAKTAGDWTRRAEHAPSVDALVKPWICAPDRMRELVKFRPVDMRRLPADLGEHDLVWSACVIEHLGSPQAGLDFIIESLALLRPGGVSVHTTEFDLTPGPQPVDYGHCALYRLVDIEGLQDDVRRLGFEMDINPYVAFEHPADRFVAPPLSVGDEEFHLKLALYQSITTSFAIVVRRPS